MTNLEWLEKIGMVTTNNVYKDEYTSCGVIGTNVVIALRDCDYSDYKEKGIEWLLEEHKESIKLKQWEKDLISLFDKGYSKDYSFSSFLYLNGLKEKGYFKGITDTSMKIEDILKNCEVIK